MILTHIDIHVANNGYILSKQNKDTKYTMINNKTNSPKALTSGLDLT